MKYRPIFIIIIISFTISCKRKVSYSGYVYSKHHVPMPDLSFSLIFGYGGKDGPIGILPLYTDRSGYFSYNGKISKKGFVSFDIKCDSGRYYSYKIFKDHVNDLEFVLE